MTLQIDQEFKQRKIFELNKKFNVDMYSTNLRLEKLLEQDKKMQNWKKTLLRSKCTEEFKGKWTKPNELIKKVTFNLNNTRSAKLDTHPNKLKNRS